MPRGSRIGDGISGTEGEQVVAIMMKAGESNVFVDTEEESETEGWKHDCQLMAYDCERTGRAFEQRASSWIDAGSGARLMCSRSKIVLRIDAKIPSQGRLSRPSDPEL